MTRQFVTVTVCLSATVAFLVGLVVAETMTPAPAVFATSPRVVARWPTSAVPVPFGAISFADVAERLNPAVVNIEASARGQGRSRRRAPLPRAEGEELFGPGTPGNGPSRGAGSGFIIDADGFILTNHHVVEGAERIMVRLTDGRTLRAELVGSDPDTDIALIKVTSPRPFPYATLGDSESLRVGDWVVAIGNPLAYEHTVTVGVVSFIGRKLFDTSLDRYIQTDAAINFGNSGGPLINVRGEVIGINAAISSRAANIGFAVPINQASAVLPQLRENGRVSRGYVGVMLRDVDPDLQRSLGLASSAGALVQDITPGSPGERAGVRTYDLIVAVDGEPVEGNDALIQLIASHPPGTTTTLQILRDGLELSLPVKLAERPLRRRGLAALVPEQPQPSSESGPLLGMSVRQIDREFERRFNLPEGTRGVIVSRVEPMGPAFDADIARGHVVLEINRQAVQTLGDYRRLTSSARPGDILTLYLYRPGLDQRMLQTVKLDEP